MAWKCKDCGKDETEVTPFVIARKLSWCLVCMQKAVMNAVK